MFFRDHIYTVHEKRDLAEPADRVVLVREGFSFWAFLFTILWLLAHRLWLMSAFFLVLAVAVAKLGMLLGLPHATIALMQFGLELWLGLVAHDAERAALTRRGYVMTGVICGGSTLMAERRYYDGIAVS